MVNMHLYTGGSLVATESSIVAPDFIKLIEEFKPNTISGVPTTYKLAERLGFHYLLGNNIKRITQAGGRLDETVKKRLLSFCLESRSSLYIMYGQTEATARITCFDLTKNPEKIDSVGKPLAGLKIEIDGTPDSQGEIILRGPSVTPGYVGSWNEVLKKSPLDQLRTGDVGYLDAQGFVYISGRLSRFAKINGHRISLDEIERYAQKELSQTCYIVSDDCKIYVVCEVMPNTKITYPNLSHRDLVYCTINGSWPIKSNGKIDYVRMLENLNK